MSGPQSAQVRWYVKPSLQGERERITRSIDEAHTRMIVVETELKKLEEKQEKEANLTKCQTEGEC